jgi:hypothetical protein
MPCTARFNIIALFSLPLLALGLASCSFAQTPAPAPVPVPMPIAPPAGLVYQYWPLQLVQFLGPELPYSLILLDADTRGTQPVYDVTLTLRDSGKRIHYVNQPALLALDNAKGDEAYLTRMQLDQPQEPAKGAQYLLRFNTEKGVPVLWQWIEGTDVSEQGSGMTPIDAPNPVFMYREQGALAAEGTALKIGTITSTADVWQEFARPPYFIPYHGALSQGVHIVVLAPVTSSWTSTQTATLAPRSTWKLTSAYGTVLTASTIAAKGGSGEIKLDDPANGSTLTLQTAPSSSAAAGLDVDRVQMGPTGAKVEHTVSIIFTPALSTASPSRFELIAGKKQRLAEGSITTSATNRNTLQQVWTVDKPDWVKGKTVTATTSATTSSAVAESTPATAAAIAMPTAAAGTTTASANSPAH